MASVYFATTLREKSGEHVDFCHVLGAIKVTTKRKTEKHYLSVFEKNGMFIISSMRNKQHLTNETLCGALINVKDAYVHFYIMFENHYDMSNIHYTLPVEMIEGE